MISITEIKAQSRRINQSIHEQGANSSLFHLYLAMSELDNSKIEAKASNDIPDDCIYSGINGPRSLAARPYAKDDDYVVQQYIQQDLINSQNPRLSLAWCMSLFPQPLNYRKQQSLLSEEVIENLPYWSQNSYKNDDFSASVDLAETEIKQPEIPNFFDYIQQAQNIEL